MTLLTQKPGALGIARKVGR